MMIDWFRDPLLIILDEDLRQALYSRRRQFDALFGAGIVNRAVDPLLRERTPDQPERKFRGSQHHEVAWWIIVRLVKLDQVGAESQVERGLDVVGVPESSSHLGKNFRGGALEFD